MEAISKLNLVKQSLYYKNIFYLNHTQNQKTEALEVLAFYDEKIKKGWRINENVEKEYLDIQKRIYENLEIKATLKEEIQDSIEITLKIWNLLKKAGCKNFFEVFELETQDVQIEKFNQNGFDDKENNQKNMKAYLIFSNLCDDIFVEELKQAPQYINCSVEGLIKRIGTKNTIEEKHPFEWAKSLGLKIVTRMEVYRVLQRLNNLPNKEKSLHLSLLKSALDDQKILISKTKGKRRLPQNRFLAKEILRKSFISIFQRNSIYYRRYLPLVNWRQAILVLFCVSFLNCDFPQVI